MRLDIIFGLVALIGPVVLVLLWNRVGIVLGGLVAWGAFLLAIHFERAAHPGGPDSVGGLLWLVTGWFFGLVYSGMIYGAKRWFASSGNRQE